MQPPDLHKNLNFAALQPLGDPIPSRPTLHVVCASLSDQRATTPEATGPAPSRVFGHPSPSWSHLCVEGLDLQGSMGDHGASSGSFQGLEGVDRRREFSGSP